VSVFGTTQGAGTAGANTERGHNTTAVGFGVAGPKREIITEARKVQVVFSVNTDDIDKRLQVLHVHVHGYVHRPTAKRMSTQLSRRHMHQASQYPPPKIVAMTHKKGVSIERKKSPPHLTDRQEGKKERKKESKHTPDTHAPPPTRHLSHN
jgi:hypothetical protein